MKTAKVFGLRHSQPVRFAIAQTDSRYVRKRWALARIAALALVVGLYLAVVTAPPMLATNAAGTAFNPPVHGFHFSNSWSGQRILIDVPLVGTVDFGPTTYGLCGGMSYAALDTFKLGGQAPPDTTSPTSGPVRSYIYQRQIDSFKYDNGFIVRQMIEWIVRGDNTDARGTGVHVLTHREFLHKIRPELDAGRPVPIAIVRATVSVNEAVKLTQGSPDNPLFENHQVVAIGYEHHENIDEPHWDVHIYDPNFPGTTQTLHTATDHHRAYQTPKGGTQQTGKFRGFFKLPYRTERPPWVPAQPGKLKKGGPLNIGGISGGDATAGAAGGVPLAPKPAATSAGQAARGAANPASPCCSITAIDNATGVVSARVTATGQTFRFKVTDASLLRSMKLGQGVYANFKANQVSVNGEAPCCSIVN